MIPDVQTPQNTAALPIHPPYSGSTIDRLSKTRQDTGSAFVSTQAPDGLYTTKEVQNLFKRLLDIETSRSFEGESIYRHLQAVANTSLHSLDIRKLINSPDVQTFKTEIKTQEENGIRQEYKKFVDREINSHEKHPKKELLSILFKLFNPLPYYQSQKKQGMENIVSEFLNTLYRQKDESLRDLILWGIHHMKWDGCKGQEEKIVAAMGAIGSVLETSKITPERLKRWSETEFIPTDLEKIKTIIASMQKIESREDIRDSLQECIRCLWEKMLNFELPLDELKTKQANYIRTLSKIPSDLLDIDSLINSSNAEELDKKITLLEEAFIRREYEAFVLKAIGEHEENPKTELLSVFFELFNPIPYYKRQEREKEERFVHQFLAILYNPMYISYRDLILWGVHHMKWNRDEKEEEIIAAATGIASLLKPFEKNSVALEEWNKMEFIPTDLEKMKTIVTSMQKIESMEDAINIQKNMQRIWEKLSDFGLSSYELQNKQADYIRILSETLLESFDLEDLINSDTPQELDRKIRLSDNHWPICQDYKKFIKDTVQNYQIHPKKELLSVLYKLFNPLPDYNSKSKMDTQRAVHHFLTSFYHSKTDIEKKLVSWAIIHLEIENLSDKMKIAQSAKSNVTEIYSILKTSKVTSERLEDWSRVKFMPTDLDKLKTIIASIEKIESREDANKIQEGVKHLWKKLCDFGLSLDELKAKQADYIQILSELPSELLNIEDLITSCDIEELDRKMNR